MINSWQLPVEERNIKSYYVQFPVILLSKLAVEVLQKFQFTDLTLIMNGLSMATDTDICYLLGQLMPPFHYRYWLYLLGQLMPPFHYRYWLYLLSAGTANASISLQILALSAICWDS